MISKSSQKIFNNSLLYSIGTLFSKAVGFFLVPIYTYCVSDADYGIATTITTFITTFGIVIMLSLRAAMIRFYNEYDEQEKLVFVGSITSFVSINAFVTVLISIFAKEIVTIMAEKSFLNAWKMVPFFIITQLVAFIYYSHVQSVMYNVKMSKFTSICSMSSLAVNVTLCLLLVTSLNIYGILVSRLLAQIVMATLTVIMSRKSEKVDFGLGKMIIKIFLAAILSVTGVFISTRHIGINVIEIILKVVVALVAFTLFIYPYRQDLMILLKGLFKKQK